MLINISAIIISAPADEKIANDVRTKLRDNGIIALPHDYSFGQEKYPDTYFKELPKAYYIIIISKQINNSTVCRGLISTIAKNKSKIISLFVDKGPLSHDIFSALEPFPKITYGDNSITNIAKIIRGEIQSSDLLSVQKEVEGIEVLPIAQLVPTTKQESPKPLNNQPNADQSIEQHHIEEINKEQPAPEEPVKEEPVKEEPVKEEPVNNIIDTPLVAEPEPITEPSNPPKDINPISHESEKSYKPHKSKWKWVAASVILIIALVGGAYLGHYRAWWDIPFLSTKYSSSESLEFMQLTGSESGEYNTYSYGIAWPVGTNEQLVSALQQWVVGQITEETVTNYSDIDRILKKAATEFIENESSSKSINIWAQQNYPFESYVTMTSEVQAGHSVSLGSICINTANNTVFPADESIADTDLMRKLIATNIQSGLTRDDQTWSEEIPAYSPETVPMPTAAPTLKPEGLEFTYTMNEISIGYIYCLVSYDEAIPAMTAKAKAFLPASIVEEADKKAAELESAKSEAIKFFYQSYYNNDNIVENNAIVGRQGMGYSEEIKNKFNELGISSEIDYPVNQVLNENNDFYRTYFSDDLNSLLQEVSKAIAASNNFELMMLMQGEFEGGEPFNLVIKDVNVVSSDKVNLTVEEIDCYPMDVILIKQDGKWFIDDIYGYRENANMILN